MFAGPAIVPKPIDDSPDILKVPNGCPARKPGPPGKDGIGAMEVSPVIQKVFHPVRLKPIRTALDGAGEKMCVSDAVIN